MISLVSIVWKHLASTFNDHKLDHKNSQGIILLQFISVNVYKDNKHID